MTRHQVARALEAALEVESLARATVRDTADLPDRDAAMVVARHATALRKTLERWIAKRALREDLLRDRAEKMAATG